MVGIKQYYHITFPEPEWQLVTASASDLAAPIAALMPAHRKCTIVSLVRCMQESLHTQLLHALLIL